ncbi:mitochondrial inner membrane protein-domain-containing protein [Entophlyctis helioformis]|nr:mitochondrial inner membrane protein-domain-containing protein [Entophlyctis helioformis]
MFAAYSSLSSSSSAASARRLVSALARSPSLSHLSLRASARSFSSSAEGGSSFRPVRFILGTTALVGTAYVGTAYAATLDDNVHKFWIDNKIPGGEAALDAVRKAEAQIKATKVEDIQKTANETIEKLSKTANDLHQKTTKTIDSITKTTTETVDTITKTASNLRESAETAFDQAGRAIHQATETVTGIVDNVTTTATQTYKAAAETTTTTIAVVQSTYKSAEDSVMGIVHDVEKAVETVVETVTGVPADKPKQKPAAADAAAAAATKEVKAAVAEVKEVAKEIKEAVKETVKETAAPVVPKDEAKSEAKPVPAPAPVAEKKAEPKQAAKEVKPAAKAAAKAAEPKPADKDASDLDDATIEAIATAVSGDAAKPAAPVALIDLDAIIKTLPADKPILERFSVTLHDLALTLDKLTNENAPPSTQASRLSLARDHLLALTTFLQHLKAEEVALVQSSLEEQSVAFEHIVDTIYNDALQSTVKQTAELESAFVAKLAQQRATLAQEHEKQLADSLLRQADEFRSALERDLQRQAAELEKFWSQEVRNRVDLERDGRLARLDHLALKVKFLERISLDAGEGYDRNRRIHQLQSAVRALDAVLSRPSSANFTQEFKVLATLGEGDAFVSTVLSTLPADIATRYTSLADLVHYFDVIKTPVRRSQLVPNDANVFSYVLGSVASYALIPKSGLVAGSDVESILARAEYHLAHQNVDEAAREINQLTGWSKRLAQDWLAKARVHLELRQAVKTIETHLNLQSLGVL